MFLKDVCFFETFSFVHFRRRESGTHITRGTHLHNSRVGMMPS